MMDDLRAPDAAHPASFPRYLRQSGRRQRRRSGNGNRYQIILAVIWFGAGPALGAWNGLTSDPPTSSILSWPAGATLLAVGVLLIHVLATLLGPVSVPPAWAAWVLSTPLDRGSLLFGRVLRVVGVAALAGLLLGALLAAAAGQTRTTLLAGALLGAAAGGAAGSAAAVRQRDQDRVSRPVLMAIAVLVPVAAALNFVSFTMAWELWPWVGAMVAFLGAVALTVRAARVVSQVPADTLTSPAIPPAVLGFGVAELSLAGLDRSATRPRRSAVDRRRQLTGVGLAALWALEWRRARRNIPALMRWVSLTFAPYAVWALVNGAQRGPALLTLMSVLAGTAAVSGMASSARTFAADRRLPASLGLDPDGALRTTLLIPALAGMTWGLAVAPALVIGATPLLAVLVPLAATAVVLFRASRGPFRPSWVMGASYSIDMLRQFARGPGPLVAVCLSLSWLALQIGP